MTLKLAMMPGDGIGPEITAATQTVLKAADQAFGLGISWVEIAIGFDALEASGTTFPDSALDTARACDGIILGPVSHNTYPPRAEGGLNPSGELRKRLDLYANIRPARSRAGIAPRTGVPLNLVVVRENTEGFYADRNMFQGAGEMMPTADVAMAFRKITREASMNIARAGFAEAEARRLAGTGPGKLTAVHKANVMRVSDGLFLECVRLVAKDYPQIAYDERLVDAMCAHLVRDPGEFDVICTTNMFGDILSDLASEIAGSLGLAASLNAGHDFAMAQAQHGSAPDIAGQDKANPSSLIGSAAMLLDWLGAKRGDQNIRAAGKAVDEALETVLLQPEKRTGDLGGRSGTHAFAEAVAAAVTS
ncbi:3-isopropylmalate dehydrogenase [Loktanella atrilutea]|uniref:3-isopropylmalate dehydrogenase n=1 Tax=Loktanella atrilutea TaxID=366533 RepID=A0A1M5FIV2_LOKAT|nr:isocitrate/isopropylmalate dehydrogenase family protein [Loktanella atrilutea]SHF91443.1 3-isopropylmalate dehydrogenase [Loktanella atrilutea]